MFNTIKYLLNVLLFKDTEWFKAHFFIQQFTIICFELLWQDELHQTFIITQKLSLMLNTEKDNMKMLP